MAKSVTLHMILASERAFRRVVFPLFLFASSAFRFNLFSMLYFIGMLTALILPATRRSLYRVPNLILSLILIILSTIATLGQPLFQITLATDYNNTYCSHDEKIWRQCGFIQFDIDSADVVRHMLPDVVVLITSILSFLLIAMISLTQIWQKSSLDKDPESSYKPKGVKKRDSNFADTGNYHSIAEESDLQDSYGKRTSKGSIRSVDVDKQRQRSSILSVSPKKSFSYLTAAWDFTLVLLLWLSGVCVASALNFPYFAASIYLALGWALRLNHTRYFIVSQRVITIIVTLYSGINLIALYLYQFQSAQDLVPRPSISARVLGLIGLVRTDCNNPTELHVHGGLEWPDYLGPISMLFLYCMSATGVRFWFFLVKKQLEEQLPPADIKGDSQGDVGEPQTPRSNKEQQNIADSSTTGKAKVKKKSRWQRWFSRDGVISRLLSSTRNAILKSIGYIVEINFVLTLFSMMVWSLLFPSWTSFVLLMWSCVVWVTPRFNAKDAVYYSTPLLVLYAIVLLLIQYLYNMDLTEEELESNINAGLTRYHKPPAGAGVLTITLKSLFTATFMCSLREFIFLYKHQWRRYLYLGIFSLTRRDSDFEADLVPASPTIILLDDRLEKIYIYMRRYWPLATITAFLLVSLIGDVTIFKMVYMLFFLLFLLCYEIFPRYWYTIMKPVWTILIFYAFVELILIYTYQFSYIRHKWEDLFEEENAHWTSDEILQSIGFFEVSIDNLSFTNVADLFETLVPSALFVAVMALQLKYFNPLSEREEIVTRYSIQSGDDNIYNGTINEPDTSALFEKLKKHIGKFTEFCWRFLEIYMDKIIMIIAFVLVIQQVSSTHVITLFILLCPIVALRAKHLWYPFLTLYIATLIMLKMIYQVRMVEPDSFDLADNCSAIDIDNITDSTTSPVNGEVFNYKYSPRESDPAWFGFFKVECKDCSGFPSYIRTHIALVMLIACSYSVQRRQKRYYLHNFIDIPKADKMALFWGISIDEMDKSLLKTVAYLVSHIFDLYGLEICWCMLAINVAVRIDVYGVVYAIALGILLITPRRRLRLVWNVYLLVHGSLLMIQYLLVLNTPYGACIQDDHEEKELPWSNIEPLELKRWLWLPLSSDNVIILDKHWLWADFFTFLFICAESFNLHRKLLEATTPTISTQRFAFLSFANAQILLDHVKRVVLKHSFWVTLFIIFAAATAQVGVLGVVYLLACFMLLWFSGSLQLLSRRKLNCWWFILLMIVWSVLSLKISLQVWTCVYHEKEFEHDCAVTRTFNAQCEARHYYGVADPDLECDDLPRHIGLWLDVLAFTAIMIQIVLFNTTYWDLIRQSSISKHVTIDPYWVTAALLDKINKNLSKNKIRERRAKEEIRRRLLEVKEKYHTSVMEHYLRAGVILPKNIIFIGEDKALLHDRSVLVSKDLISDDIPVDPKAKLFPSRSVSPARSTSAVSSEQDDDELHRPGVWRVIGVILELVDNGLEMTIEWLCSKSTYYYYLLEKLKVQRLQESEGLQHVPALLSSNDLHHVPVVSVTASEGETGDETQATLLTGDSKSSTSSSSEDAKHEQNYLYSKETVYQMWKKISNRPLELLEALYHATLANTEYICYLLIVINVMVNGSILSLVYAALMFLWGLMSIPWPTKRFWLTLTFYTMFVILLKYGFQFQQIDWSGSPDAGIYWPHVWGIQKRYNFFKNVVWDILLLIFLFFHRGLLHETGRWEIPGYFSVRSSSDTDGQSAIKLIFKKRSELLNHGKDKSEDSEAHNVEGDDDNLSNGWSSREGDEDDDDATDNNFTVILIKSMVANVKHFYNQLFNPDISLQAHNYYTASFIMDCISFFIITIGFSSFGAEEDEGLTAVADYIQQNNVPIPFLMMLFAHFMSMVVDRAIYLRKSIAAKLIFFLLQLFIWHVWLFFILPAVTDKAFTDNVFSQALYFFKSMYLILSAQQCVSGYPKRVLGYFIAKQYNVMSRVIFTIYRAVPLLPELKEVMDWMFTPTALQLSHWLKVQEIWALLYGIKIKRQWEKSDVRVLGDPESFLAKLFIGGGLLALLVLLIWGPLLIIALLNTTNVSNPPTEVYIQLSVRSFEPLLTMKVDEQGIKELNGAQYDRLKNDYSNDKQERNTFESHFKRSDFRYILFSGRSTALWQISPPSRTALEEALKDTSSVVPLIFYWTITREPETGLASEQVSGETVKMLYSSNPEGNKTRQGLLNLLQNIDSTPVSIAHLFPQYIYAPANGPSEPLTALSHGRGVDCQASLDIRNITVAQNGSDSPVSIVEEWWSLSQTSTHHVVDGNPTDIEFVIYSEKISKPEFSFITGLGIIGLYVSVVLVIGSALRSYVSRLPSRINIDEIPDPDSLLELCDDIFYVREDRRLQEEEILVGRLFFTFRSSVRLISETRWKLD